MNSRQRVVASMNGKAPDAVPVDFGAHRSSGIMALAYARLREYLGLPKMTLRVYDIPQQLAVIDDDVLDLFHADTIELGRGFCLQEEDWKPWELPDGTPCVIPSWINPAKHASGDWVICTDQGVPSAVQKQGTLYFETIHYPMQEDPYVLKNLEKAVSRTMWTGTAAAPPGPISLQDEADLAYLRRGAEALRRSTDRAVVGLFGGNLFELGQWLFGMENFFSMLASEPDYMHQFLDRLTEMHLKNLEGFLKAAGSSIDVIAFGDDLGMQTGPLISPAMFRDFFKPRQQRMWARVKELSDVKIMIHSCGGIAGFLDDMIDAGLDAVNPVQIQSAGMEPEQLKQRFGSRITFWGGGCDTQEVLNYGTPETIREHVLRNLEVFSPGGRYVFQQVHNIMADIPPENITAMFKAAAEFNGRSL